MYFPYLQGVAKSSPRRVNQKFKLTISLLSFKLYVHYIFCRMVIVQAIREANFYNIFLYIIVSYDNTIHDLKAENNREKHSVFEQIVQPQETTH